MTKVRILGCNSQDFETLLEHGRLQDILKSTEYIDLIRQDPVALNQLLDTVISHISAPVVASKPTNAYLPINGAFSTWAQTNQIDPELIKSKVIATAKEYLSEQYWPENEPKPQTADWYGMQSTQKELLKNYLKLAERMKGFYPDQSTALSALIGDKETAARMLSLYKKHISTLSRTDICEVLPQAVDKLGIGPKECKNLLVPKISEICPVRDPSRAPDSYYYNNVVAQQADLIIRADLNITKDSMKEMDDASILYFVWMHPDHINIKDAIDEFTQRDLNTDQATALLSGADGRLNYKDDLYRHAISPDVRIALLGNLLQDMPADTKTQAIINSTLPPQTKLLAAQIWNVLPQYLEKDKERIIHQCGEKGLAAFTKKDTNLKMTPRIAQYPNTLNDAYRSITVIGRLDRNAFKEEIKEDQWCFNKLIESVSKPPSEMGEPAKPWRCVEP